MARTARDRQTGERSGQLRRPIRRRTAEVDHRRTAMTRSVRVVPVATLHVL
jgi:hypothetical protein